MRVFTADQLFRCPLLRAGSRDPRQPGDNPRLLCSGQQAKYGIPQQGDITVVDSTGTTVGTGTITSGTASIEFDAVAAPGPVQVTFAGDHQSSYLTNFKSFELLARPRLRQLGFGNQFQRHRDSLYGRPETERHPNRPGCGTVSFGLTVAADQTPILILQKPAPPTLRP